jgi:NTP pyrophosphatase (non-canonical NTP hydrolase)
MFGLGDKDENNRAREETIAKGIAYYSTLRDANAARQLVWDPEGFARNIDWRANELAGEIGETNNILKKLHREACGIRGSRATKDDLADELADAVICVDLLLIEWRVQTPDYTVSGKPSDMLLTQVGRLLAVACGKLCAATTEEEVVHPAYQVIGLVRHVATRYGINLEDAVRNKFNMTSRKNNLPVELGERD